MGLLNWIKGEKVTRNFVSSGVSVFRCFGVSELGQLGGIF